MQNTRRRNKKNDNDIGEGKDDSNFRARINIFVFFWLTQHFFGIMNSPDGNKKAYIKLTADVDALDVANKIGFI